MKLISKLTLALATLPALLGSCSSNDPGEDDKYVGMSLVTYEGTANSFTTFTYQALNDSPLITFTTQWTPNPPQEPGTRMLIVYSSKTLPTNGGDITLRQASLVYGGKLSWIKNATDWRSEPIQLNALWRTGHYINLDCFATYNDGNKRELTLSVDSTTASTPCPVLYLSHENKNTDMIYDQRVYASWNVDTLWSRPDVQSIRVKLVDCNGNNEFTFSKTDSNN